MTGTPNQARNQGTWAQNLFVPHLVLPPLISSKLCILICAESHFAFPINPMETKHHLESLPGLEATERSRPWAQVPQPSLTTEHLLLSALYLGIPNKLPLDENRFSLNIQRSDDLQCLCNWYASLKEVILNLRLKGMTGFRQAEITGRSLKVRWDRITSAGWGETGGSCGNCTVFGGEGQSVKVSQQGRGSIKSVD